MNNNTLGAVGVFVVTLLLSSSADAVLAQGRGRGQSKTRESGAKTKVVVEPVFGTHDREVITQYYAKRSGLPPGLAKRDGNLPPGLEKQLQRNGTLPPGLQKKLRPFPVTLERQLSPLPRGFRRGIVDQHLVVYRTGTYVIADSFLNAVR